MAHARSAVVVLVSLWLTVAQSAAGADEGAIKYRKAVMEAVGGHMQAMVGVLKREVPHADHLAAHARAIADLAAMAPTLFPEGSGEGRTEAMPEIWEDPDDFAARLREFRSAADALAATGGEMPEFAGALQNLGKSCKGCHDRYKKE